MKKIISYIMAAALVFVIGCEKNTVPTSSEDMQTELMPPQNTLPKAENMRRLELSFDKAHQAQPRITREEASRIDIKEPIEITASSSQQYSPYSQQWWIASAWVVDVTQVGGDPTLYIGASVVSTPDVCE